MRKPYETVKSETVFRGLIVDVKQDTIVLPDEREAVREVVVRGGAAAVVPVDAEGNIWFVRQYRHPAGEEVLEIPAGMLNDEEAPLDCAVRELEEETGWKAGKMTLLTEMYPSVGYCTEVLHVFLAEGLSQGETNPDEDEFLTVEVHPAEEAVRMIFDGRIRDGKTVAGVLAYREMCRGID